MAQQKAKNRRAPFPNFLLFAEWHFKPRDYSWGSSAEKLQTMRSQQRGRCWESEGLRRSKIFMSERQRHISKPRLSDSTQMQTNEHKGTEVSNCLKHPIHWARPSLERISLTILDKHWKTTTKTRFKNKEEKSAVLGQRLEDRVPFFPTTLFSLPLCPIFLTKAATLPHLLPDKDKGSTCPQTKFIHQSALIPSRQCLKALLKYLLQLEPSHAATLKNPALP